MARPKTTSRHYSVGPVLPKAIPRERLFQQLDRFQEGPVIWVSGPAGCGKTTLVSSYFQDQESPTSSTRSRRPIRTGYLFYHLSNAFSIPFPEEKKTCPS